MYRGFQLAVSPSEPVTPDGCPSCEKSTSPPCRRVERGGGTAAAPKPGRGPRCKCGKSAPSSARCLYRVVVSSGIRALGVRHAMFVVVRRFVALLHVIVPPRIRVAYNVAEGCTRRFPGGSPDHLTWPH
eukprot:4525441-Pyramimonas_sp.AAC.1